MKGTVACVVVGLAVLALPELGASHPRLLASPEATVEIDPATMETTLTLEGGRPWTVSRPLKELGEPAMIHEGPTLAAWSYPVNGLSVEAAIAGATLHTTFTLTQMQGAGGFQWPVMPADRATHALIWPRAEGAYVPLDDTTWTEHLVTSSPWNTTADLSMPFWGIQRPDGTLAVIATNPYNNTISLDAPDTASVILSFRHEHPGNHASRSHGFEISAAPDRDPVAPATRYRQHLKSRGEFVPMAEKMRLTTAAELLLGAPHVYLWGDAPFTRHDLKNPKGAGWKEFCSRVVAEGFGPERRMGVALGSVMTQAEWAALETVAAAEYPDKYSIDQAAAAFSRVLVESDLAAAMHMTGKPAPANAADRVRQNADLLYQSQKDLLRPPQEWGGGVSVRMLDALKARGLDRLKLCVAGWEGVEQRPWVARRAAELGYLFGTYDSFHSMHDPATSGSESTWPTAQFDEALWETGRILDADGNPLRGFKKLGFKVSPIAAWPWVERRVEERLSRVPYNYYFVDCDAFGEVYDDFTPSRPATQADDAAARAGRMRWLAADKNLVVGSEGGSAYAAPVIHVAEGIVTPVFGWGDPDLHDKQKKSKYYLGEYYPPDGPRVFMKTVPLKEKHSHLYFDPRFRLPLYEIVFHDSVVSTHHWSGGSLKFTDTSDTVRLVEMLYQVPPMYHLNLDELAVRGDDIAAHYGEWSPLHRRLGFQAMTGFTFLTPDRLVQETRFEDGTSIIANFGSSEFRHRGKAVAPRSVAVSLPNP